MTGGTYTLIISVPESIETEVGALGDIQFPAGEYAYTGSALGSGGFARVDRHRRLAAGENSVRHWHIDYLLGHSGTELVAVVGRENADVECTVAHRLPDGPVEGYGASDCSCHSHLAYSADKDLRAIADRVYRGLDEGRPVTEPGSGSA